MENHVHLLLETPAANLAITTDAQLLTAARYLALNPVAAGLCAKAAEWRWGSYAAVATGAPAWLDHARLLQFFSGSGGDPHRRYVEFVEEG